MTGVANTEFYMQDGTGGIAVFWSGANATSNLPPAGALVKVTGPLSSFSGLLEIAPVFTNALHSVTVLSTNNPLPTAQPLPFDPNITSDVVTMRKMEGMYLVASNVTVAPGATFTAVGEPLSNNKLAVKTFTDSILTVQFTNDVGQVFTMFINGSTDIPGKAKPAGAVTIFGVLGYHSPEGFEFTPSRYADIITYSHVTNTVTHVKRFGDLLTNSYVENVLRTGETMTSVADITDIDGGTVTLTPDLSTLPPSASWDSITTGSTATAKFHFTPVPGDAGSNYTVNLLGSSTSGNSFTNKFTVYVPTATEQKVAITEFLANPTTNSSLPNFNPLHRATDTTGISSNDIYLEIANVSSTPVDFTDWVLNQGTTIIEDFDAVPPAPPALAGNSAMVIYGGSSSDTPNLTTPAFDATGTGFILPNTKGTIILRNKTGNIVDRVVYAATDLSTNGSLTRFPTIDSPLVLQELVNTNRTTAGLQYDGGPWSLASQVPAGVSNIVTVAGSPLNLTFTVDPAKMTTLWSASTLADTFRPVAGKQFPTTSGSFNITNTSPTGFYFITSQTNYPATP
jgi:lamin tail-like protein